MNVYDFISIIILPYTLLTFITGYLSDIEISNKETLVGVLQLLHHLIVSLITFGPLSGILFGVRNIYFILLITLIFLVAQICFLINNDYCFYTMFVNKIINPENPKRKLLADIFVLIKKYIREDEWAYSPIINTDNTLMILIVNFLIILSVVRIIINK